MTKKIHFIGIGGIGVSALAQYYLSRGSEVSGSDLESSEITELLEKRGAKVFIGMQKSENISGDVSFVVYSPAVKHDNLEYVTAKELGIKLQSYPQALGDLTKEYFTIAVSGTHGKSTTTTLISLILTEAGRDPNVIVGTKVREFGDTNFRAGKSNVLVIEACEYDSSFLEYLPRIAVITNIEKEHLDYFKNLKNILKAFLVFASRLPKDGVLVINGDDQNSKKLFNKKSKVLNPSQIQNFRIRQKDSVKLKKILKVPGKHNVYNALAALTVSRILGIPDKVSSKALSEYRGAWRRFDLKETTLGGKKITLISDYGHHPTEINATLTATREKFPKKNVWCVFQPHQHQRTHYLYKDFVNVFKKAKINNIIITDIYDVAGRETTSISKNISSQKLVKSIKKKNVIYLPMGDIKKYLEENIKNGDVLLIMGAGDVYNLVKQIG